MRNTLILIGLFLLKAYQSYAAYNPVTISCGYGMIQEGSYPHFIHCIDSTKFKTKYSADSVTTSLYNAINAHAVKITNKAGVLSNTGILFADSFSISSATPTIQLGTYIRARGCTKAFMYTACGLRWGGSVTNSPQVAITGFTDTTLTLAVTQQNTAVVTILGINVLSGLPLIGVSDFSSNKVMISACFY